MANDYQWLIRWQDIGARWDLRHRNMQGALELAKINLSCFPHIENRMLPSRAPHVCKLANGDCI